MYVELHLLIRIYGKLHGADSGGIQIYFFDELFYVSALALTKISILLLYLRIFPNKAFRYGVYITIALCALYMLVFVLVFGLQCIPFDISWTRWDGEHHGRCINVNVIGWMAATLNIILEVTVMCLPLREISKLAMSRRRKAGLLVIFLGGILSVLPYPIPAPMTPLIHYEQRCDHQHITPSMDDSIRQLVQCDLGLHSDRILVHT